ncbi:MAG: glycogen synthase [Ignavibacteria bacterium]|nr:glycogen synthase [Ignavibacteria bacterium]
MNILLVAAEVSPYAKVGGLADMAGTLPRAWSVLGNDVRIVLPLYGNIDKAQFGITKLDLLVSVPFGSWTEYAEVWHGILPDSEVDVYFVRSSDYYDRPGIYGYHDGFEDNDRRFMFLSRAAFEVARALDFKPDVIHAHDYHTAVCMPLLKVQYIHDPFFASTAGVFTIHNMAFQGFFDPLRAMEFCGLPPSDFYSGCWYEHDGCFNAMKSGIMFADKVTTVSPTYAQEIRWTPEGKGLQGALQSRSADVIGVLNGINTSEWDPATDQHITATYTPATLESKTDNKRSLLREVGFADDDVSDDLPVVGMVTRLTEQKGLSILQHALPQHLREGSLRLVVLGSGEHHAENFLRDLEHEYHHHVRFVRGYNEPLSHRIQAGSDYYLMPSLFEPCGLTQMFALRYGTVPIVRGIGGLGDTVEEYDPITVLGTGVRFYDYSADELSRALWRALRLYKQEPHWTHIRRNAMNVDNSIVHTAERYLEVFSWAQEKVR